MIQNALKEKRAGNCKIALMSHSIVFLYFNGLIQPDLKKRKVEHLLVSRSFRLALYWTSLLPR